MLSAKFGSIINEYQKMIMHYAIKRPEKGAELRALVRDVKNTKDDVAAVNLLDSFLALGTDFSNKIDDHNNPLSSGYTDARLLISELHETLQFELANEGMSRWMLRLSDDTKLADITMPGSHDAGVYEDPKDNRAGSRLESYGPTPIATAVCQKYSIKRQLQAGVRYFDIRLGFENLNKEPKITDSRAFHGVAVFGAWGAMAEIIADDIIGFLKSHESEFLIIKLTRVSSVKQIQLLMDGLERAEMLWKHDYKNKPNHDITQLTVEQLRGKAVLIVEMKNEDDLRKMIPDINGMRPVIGFVNFKGDKRDLQSEESEPDRLEIFGGTTGDSSSLLRHGNNREKGKAKRSALVEGQLKKAHFFKGHRENQLFQMSVTCGPVLGVGSVRAWTEIVGTHGLIPALVNFLDLHCNNTNHVVEPLRSQLLDLVLMDIDDSDKEKIKGYSFDASSRPNFIHMDFCNPVTCKYIVSLNPDISGFNNKEISKSPRPRSAAIDRTMDECKDDL